ncbi:MAG TPA: YciI family protein [Vicinamibacterales bacterium]|nr:YciI family protein [Vicinamibacterales bacterium]
MRYALLIYETPEHFEFRLKDSEEERAPEYGWGPWQAYYKALVDAGVYVGGTPLQHFTTGTTVRIRGGQRQVQDGPYAATKEHLGGLILLELSSLDEALDWAARCPVASTGVIEVRPVSDEVLQKVTGGNG